MRIIFIGPMRLPITIDRGAIEKIIYYTSKKLYEKGHKVFIFNPISNNYIQMFFNSVFLYKLIRKTKKEDEFIIHFHNLVASPAFLIDHRIPAVLTLHYPPWIIKFPISANIRLKILNLLTKTGLTITVPSQYVKNRLASIGLRSYYIPNGVDIVYFNPLKRNEILREKLLEGADFLLLNVARVYHEKNQLDILRALNYVKKYNKYFKVIFVGPLSESYDYLYPNEYFNLLNNYILKYNLKNNVRFMGEMPYSKVAEIMASSDIYLHPSLVECFPLTILEAAASRLPIVAYDLPYYQGILIHGLNSLISHTGNVFSLADNILKLMEDKKLALRLGLNARQMVEKIFSWDKIVNQYQKLYFNIIEYGI